MIWCAISPAGIVGPLFLDHKVDAQGHAYIVLTKLLADFQRYSRYLAHNSGCRNTLIYVHMTWCKVVNHVTSSSLNFSATQLETPRALCFHSQVMRVNMEETICQQEGARVHTANAVLHFLSKYFHDPFLSTPYPARSGLGCSSSP
jgi:hypothetical protein